MLKARLIQLGTDETASRHRLNGGSNVLGRSRENELVITDTRASRRHCRITVEPLGVFLEELGSRNGTLLNRRLVQSGVRVPVYHDDELRIGATRFRFSIRDRDTRQPHERPARPDLAETPVDGYVAPNADEGLRQLLGELDSIAIGASDGPMDSQEDTATFEELQAILHRGSKRQAGAKQVESGRTSGADKKARPRGQNVSPDSTARASVANADGKGAVTNDIARSPTKSSPGSSSSLDSKLARDPLAADTDATEIVNKKPQKLPDHLRPGRTKDSQDAARAALKNLFGGGG